MFDLAIRPQPNASSAAAVFGVPFDLRLVQPTPPRALPWTDYLSPTGAPQLQTDMLQVYSLELEDSLSTAVILSLFTDRRATRDDVLPLGQSDRRGWIGDELLAQDQDVDRWGSALWLCLVGKADRDTLERARFAAEESLAWLLRDGIASRIEVTTEWVGERADRLAVRPVIWQGDQSEPVYDVLWGTSIRRWATT